MTIIAASLPPTIPNTLPTINFSDIATTASSSQEERSGDSYPPRKSLSQRVILEETAVNGQDQLDGSNLHTPDDVGSSFPHQTRPDSPRNQQQHTGEPSIIIDSTREAVDNRKKQRTSTTMVESQPRVMSALEKNREAVTITSIL